MGNVRSTLKKKAGNMENHRKQSGNDKCLILSIVKNNPKYYDINQIRIGKLYCSKFR